MKILNPWGEPISSLEDWAHIFSTGKKGRHWKEHRSAFSLAKYVMHLEGLAKIRSKVAFAINEPVEFSKAIVEQELRFDCYGHGREHDLGIHGVTESGKSVFVGLEAKVDESFGIPVIQAYIDCKAKQLSGISTNAPQRIEGLLKANFGEVKPHHFNIRYQLLYATAGTIAAGADLSVLYVLVFKTPLYDEIIGAENYRDYVVFMNHLGAENRSEATDLDHRVTEFNDKPLICMYEQIALK